MSHDVDHDTSARDDKPARLQDTVRRLVLMKETGPKSAAWHRARVQTIWRLQRMLERQSGSQPSQDRHTASAPQAQEREDAKADDNRA
jgi:uncharacterized coiled-coil DUF342 family protein